MLTEGWRDAPNETQIEPHKINMTLPVAEQAKGE
ncbi:hypothetical protein HLBENOHH_00865 [Aeromonas dhakensis]